MRKILGILAIAVFVVSISLSALAEEPKGSMMSKGMMGEKGKMMKSGKMMGMCPMHDMMKTMMKKEMVATQDGGVIIMTGNKLLKYDKDLNLQKEVELKMDMEGMQKMMQEMKEKCPMYGEMMEKGSMMGGSAEEAGHEAHH